MVKNILSKHLMISFFPSTDRMRWGSQARPTKLKYCESQLFWNYLEFSLFKITWCLIKHSQSQIWNVSSFVSLHSLLPSADQTELCAALIWYDDGVAAAPDSQLYSSLGTELWAGWVGREGGDDKILKYINCIAAEWRLLILSLVIFILCGRDGGETNRNIILVQLNLPLPSIS